jgi:hypothetical protein
VDPTAKPLDGDALLLLFLLGAVVGGLLRVPALLVVL